jgi:cell division protein ZipA
MNKKVMYCIGGFLLLIIIGYFFLKSNSNSEQNKYLMSTQSESRERLKDLNLDKASEDASYILDTTRLSFQSMSTEDENIEYKADSDLDWIINLVSISGENFKKEDLSKMFDADWRNNFPSLIYGFSPETNKWTFVSAGGAPEIYSKLEIAIDLKEIFNEEKPSYNSRKLERYVTELEKRIKKYPVKINLEKKESIESAIQKAKILVSTYNEFNLDEIIVLQSDKQFDGLETWDVLQSVGLQWGDGDLFHWNNNRNYGHDQYFSVWTTTEPGYFLPEEIKDRNMNPQNLVFGYSVPRSADPKNVFEVMLNAVKYCQKRLGGNILNKDMKPIDVAQERNKINELIKNMDNKKIKTGSDKALKMF